MGKRPVTQRIKESSWLKYGSLTLGAVALGFTGGLIPKCSDYVKVPDAQAAHERLQEKIVHNGEDIQKNAQAIKELGDKIDAGNKAVIEEIRKLPRR